MSSASSHFFELPELLELLLLKPQFAPVQVMALQRVNKRFEATIVKSPRIQRKIFRTQDQRHAGKNRNDYNANKSFFTPNTTLFPGPDNTDPPRHFASDDFRIHSSSPRAFRMRWAEQGTPRPLKGHRSQTDRCIVLVIEIVRDATEIADSRVLPPPFLKMYLTDITVGFVASLDDGDVLACFLWVPAGKMLGEVLERCIGIHRGDVRMASVSEMKGCVEREEFFLSEEQIWRLGARGDYCSRRDRNALMVAVKTSGAWNYGS